MSILMPGVEIFLEEKYTGLCTYAAVDTMGMRKTRCQYQDDGI